MKIKTKIKVALISASATIISATLGMIFTNEKNIFIAFDQNKTQNVSDIKTGDKSPVTINNGDNNTTNYDIVINAYHKLVAIDTEKLKVREEPNNHCNVLKLVYCDEKFLLMGEVKDEDNNTWCKILIDDDIIGYVHSDYVTILN